MRSTAGCRCTPSAISSTSASDSSSAPTGPGSRWWSPRMALKRWVPTEAPASSASRATSYVASVWPIAATTPAAAMQRTASIPPGSSGARVTIRTAPSPAASRASTDAGSGSAREPGWWAPGAARAEPRTLEVHAGEHAVLHRQGQLAHGAHHRVAGVGDQAGGHRRGAVGQVGGRDGRPPRPPYRCRTTHPHPRARACPRSPGRRWRRRGRRRRRSRPAGRPRRPRPPGRRRGGATPARGPAPG